jgi:hypothetical protein
LSCCLGCCLSCSLGCCKGCCLGCCKGCCLGCCKGCCLGCHLGCCLSCHLGCCLSCCLGCCFACCCRSCLGSCLGCCFRYLCCFCCTALPQVAPLHGDMSWMRFAFSVITIICCLSLSLSLSVSLPLFLASYRFDERRVRRGEEGADADDFVSLLCENHWDAAENSENLDQMDGPFNVYAARKRVGEKAKKAESKQAAKSRCTSTKASKHTGGC